MWGIQTALGPARDVVSSRTFWDSFISLNIVWGNISLLCSISEIEVESLSEIVCL
jgi:hypothetical protein